MEKNFNKIDISVAVAILNEERKIIDLLDSLSNQTIAPFEIILSDGGSTDKTLALVKKYIETKGSSTPTIKVFNRDGKCRGSGRNTAIKNCHSHYVALIDCGHEADQHWIEGFHSIIKEHKNVDVIYGNVKPNTKKDFSKILSSFVLGNTKHSGKMQKSVASLLINKKVWEKVGKFDESKDGSYIVEDLSFLKKIDNNNFKKYNSKLSTTYWLLVENKKELFNKYSDYSEGAINAGYFKVWHLGVLRNYTVYFLVLFLSFFTNINFIFLIFLIVFVRSYLYLNKSSWFNSSALFHKITYLFRFTYLLFVIDLSTFKGLSKWLYKKIFK